MQISAAWALTVASVPFEADGGGASKYIWWSERGWGGGSGQTSAVDRKVKFTPDSNAFGGCPLPELPVVDEPMTAAQVLS